MAWSLVREVATPALPATAVSQVITLGAPATSVAAGNLLVVDVGVVTATLSTPFVSSSTANAGALGAWTVALNSNGGGTGEVTAFCFAIVKGALTATDTITLTFSATCQPTMQVEEFSAGFVIATAVVDKSTSSGATGNATFSSGTTAALTGASDLILGGITFDDGTGTNTITPAVLSPAWQSPTTAVKTGPGSMRHSMRWRDPGSTSGAIFNGTVSGTTPDWGAGVVAITATPAASSGGAPTYGPRRTQARRIGPRSFVEQRTYSPPPVVVVPGQNNQSLPFFGVGS